MKNVVKDDSAYQNALARQQNANSAVTSSYQTAQQLYYNEQVSDLQQRQIDTQRTYNAINAGLNIAELAVSYGSKIYDVVQQSQSTSVQNEITTSLQEGQRLVQNSIASGKTYFGTNPATGEMELIMAPEVEQWYNASREKIDSGNYMASIKKSALQSFDLSYEALKTNANGTLVEKYYSDLNTNFATSLELAKQADIQSYVQAGGDIEVWNASSTIQGVKAINSRSDWSSDARQAQTTSYLLEVQQEGDTQIASKIATTEGLQAALNYIEGKGYYTTAERQKMFASASTAATYAKTAAEEEASAIMEDAFTNNSATPEQVYAALQQQYGSSSPAVQTAAKNAAILKQTELVQSMVNNQLVADKTEGISALYDTYQSFQSGAWDDKFYNIEDVKSSAISSYSSALTSAQEQIAKTTASEIEAIDDSNKTMFSQYQELQKANLSNYDNGAITGAEYVEREIAYAQGLISSLQEGGSTDVSYWTERTTSLATAAIQSISGTYVPKRYQSAVDAACDYIKISMGNNVTSANMTAEIADSIYQSNLEFTGRVADYIRENGATMTDEEFAEWVRKEAENYVLMKDTTAYKILSEGAVYDETSMANKNSEFKSIVDTAYSNGSSSSYLVTLGKNVTTGESQYVFKNDEARATFDDMATVAKSQIQWLTGIDEQYMTVELDNTGKDGVAFAPLVVVNDGSNRVFRFDGDGNIYVSIAGERDKDGTVVWSDTGFNMSNSVEAMDKQKKRNGNSLAFYGEGGNKIISDSGTGVTAASKWVNEHNGEEFTVQQIADYLKSSDDIEAAAKELKELYEEGKIKFDAKGITFQQHVNYTVSALMNLRRKGKI